MVVVPRLLLIHWNADEAESRLARLERAGFEATAFTDPRAGLELRKVRTSPPDAFVIDLSRLPSHGREVATYLRQAAATRHVPIVFVEGEAEKLERIRALLPDAAYTSWRGVKGALTRALRTPRAAPVVPKPMAGYSGTPLPRKLAIRDDSEVALVGAPDGFEALLEPRHPVERDDHDRDVSHRARACGGRSPSR